MPELSDDQKDSVVSDFVKEYSRSSKLPLKSEAAFTDLMSGRTINGKDSYKLTIALSNLSGDDTVAAKLRKGIENSEITDDERDFLTSTFNKVVKDLGVIGEGGQDAYYSGAFM